VNELETAKLAAIEAGKIALKYFQGDFELKYKGPRNIVTQADTECEQRIKKVISKEHPGHAFLGEEFGSEGSSKHLWIIDPIDGTTNFSHGVDQFCHSIAYTRDGRVLCGVVYNPVQKKMYTAEYGRGSRMNGRKIFVSKTDLLENSLLISGFPYDEPALEEKTFASMKTLRPRCRDIRRFGSAALDLCYVAQGVCDAFFEYRLNAWDVAAGMLIVAEAGGKVTDINGAEALVDSGHFLATNAHLHDQMLSHLERV